jgi:ABC-type multidrug transport system ATPase subunit
MRQIFEYALNNDITILLTSHSMEECQLLSTRFGIMSHGQFQCLSFINDFNKKFNNQYFIHIKGNSNYFQNLFSYLKKQIQIQIINQTESTIIFQCYSSTISFLFQIIEQIKEEYFIETYLIQQTNLEQIFMHFQDQNY